jgi:hypothetical protein
MATPAPSMRTSRRAVHAVSRAPLRVSSTIVTPPSVSTVAWARSARPTLSTTPSRHRVTKYADAVASAPPK